MKLIFAQGNPGIQYKNSRHNVGFLVLDVIAEQHNTAFIKKPKFHADIAELTISGQKILLVKPTTFYNETGQSARLLTDFYKSDLADLLVIHDDLALPFATIRTREKGSDAGNNGIKSLNAHLGLDYSRIRVGVATELRNRMPDADFVLAGFTRSETGALRELIIPKIIELVHDFSNGTFTTSSYKLTEELHTE